MHNFDALFRCITSMSYSFLKKIQLEENEKLQHELKQQIDCLNDHLDGKARLRSKKVLKHKAARKRASSPISAETEDESESEPDKKKSKLVQRIDLKEI